jgi:hypothetical protein
MTVLERFAEWYASQCDGDWEHQLGVKLYTLDNPGWAIHIDIAETPLEKRIHEAVLIERTEHDWVRVSCDGTTFQLHCGPRNLEEAIKLFCDWAGV